MLRHLVLMRHAKSSWSSLATTDHARPLNARGRRDAPRVAAELLRREWVPDAVISSDAARTRETWTRMEEVLGERPVYFSRAMYHGSIDALEEEAGLLEPDLQTVLALGHNPGWEEVVLWLTGRTVHLTTANAALLSGAGETWADAMKPRSWTIEHVIRPKEL